MKEQIVERHFTRKDVEQKVFSVHKPVKGQSMCIRRVHLLCETSAPMWLIELEFSWNDGPPSSPCICPVLLTEEMWPDGKPHLVCVTSDVVPACLASIEEEDSAIALQREEDMQRALSLSKGGRK